MCLAALFCIETEGESDTDEYDEKEEVNDPVSPIWQGSEVHKTSYGPDPTVPDPNEINQD